MIRIWCEPTERLAYVGSPLRRRTPFVVPSSKFFFGNQNFPRLQNTNSQTQIPENFVVCIDN